MNTNNDIRSIEDLLSDIQPTCDLYADPGGPEMCPRSAEWWVKFPALKMCCGMPDRSPVRLVCGPHMEYVRLGNSWVRSCRDCGMVDNVWTTVVAVGRIDS